MTLIELANKAKSGRTVIFDLDNTLYPEEQYLTHCFFSFPNRLYPSDIANDVSLYLCSEFQSEGRVDLYNKMLDKFPCGATMGEVLSAYRLSGESTSLDFFPWFYEYCELTENLPIYIVTNGNVQQQKNKIKALPFATLSRDVEVVFANLYTPKPALDCLQAFQVRSSFYAPIYVGDSAVDRDFAVNAGFEFVDVENFLLY